MDPYDITMPVVTRDSSGENYIPPTTDYIEDIQDTALLHKYFPEMPPGWTKKKYDWYNKPPAYIPYEYKPSDGYVGFTRDSTEGNKVDMVATKIHHDKYSVPIYQKPVKELIYNDIVEESRYFGNKWRSTSGKEPDPKNGGYYVVVKMRDGTSTIYTLDEYEDFKRKREGLLSKE